MHLIGIDCGLTGGIAILDNETDNETRDLLAIHPMPVIQEVIAGKKRNRVNASALADLLRPYEGSHLAVEHLQARPGRHPGTEFTLAISYGLVLGIGAALGMALHPIRPQLWKSCVGLPAGLERAKAKTAARHLAASMFPEHAGRFARVKDDGLAEAVLVAIAAAKSL